MGSNRTLKKYILKLKYLEEEYQEVLEIHDSAKREFESAIRKLHSNLNVFDAALDTPFQKSTKPNPDIQAKAADDIAYKRPHDTPQWAKKIFRKIAMITHPDKLPKDLDQDIAKKFSNMYQKAKDSVDQREFADLIMIASDLSIDIQKADIDNFSFFKKKERELQKNIKKIKQSVFWAWFHSTGDQKERIMQEFMKSKGWTSTENLRKRSRPGPGNHPGKSLSWARNSSVLKNKK